MKVFLPVLLLLALIGCQGNDNPTDPQPFEVYYSVVAEGKPALIKYLDENEEVQTDSVQADSTWTKSFKTWHYSAGLYVRNDNITQTGMLWAVMIIDYYSDYTYDPYLIAMPLSFVRLVRESE